MNDCKYFQNGICKKEKMCREYNRYGYYGDKKGNCRESTFDEYFDFEPDNEFIPIGRMCEKSSVFGDISILLTESDIKRLKSGKEILFTDAFEEYGIFIGYKAK